MSILNLKKLADSFNVPHAESTTKGHECLHCVCEAAKAEIAALEEVATAWDSQTTVELMNDRNLANASKLMDRIAEEAT